MTSMMWNPTDPKLLAVCVSNGYVFLFQVDSKMSMLRSLKPSGSGACSSEL